MARTCLLIACVLFLGRFAPANAQRKSEKPPSVSEISAMDAGYTAKIKEYTTDPQFTTDLVNHVPASATVPTPEKILGYVIGTPNKLTYTNDLYRYYEVLAAASPRVKVFRVGKSEEGRDFMMVAVSDEANLARLNQLKDATAKLADPRTIGDGDAQRLIDTGKPFYWLSGSIHSPETGSP